MSVWMVFISINTMTDGNSTLGNRFNANEEKNQYNGVGSQQLIQSFKNALFFSLLFKLLDSN